MRKGFFLSILLLVSLAAIMIYIDESDLTQISILSLEKNYSRLITSETECIEFPVYLSSKNSYIGSSESITSTYLLNSEAKMEVDTISITDMNTEESLDNTTYYLFSYRIGFEHLSLDQISIEEAVLNIHYLNDVEINIFVGDISIYFGDVVASDLIEIDRVYTTSNPDAEIEYVTGIVLGIDNYTMQNITLSSITIGSTDIFLDMSNLINLDSQIGYNEDLNALLEDEYNPIIHETIDQSVYTLQNYDLLFIPFKYLDEINPIRRFPIFISYYYMDREYKYVMDDFRYISDNISLSDNYGRIHETIHYY